MKTQKYYTLVGLNTDHVWEIIFGDYDREVVEDEKSDQEDADCSDDYLSFKIIKTNEAQADFPLEVLIESTVKCLNENICWVCEGEGRSQVLLPFGVFDGFKKEGIRECLHCKSTGDLAKGTPEAISEVQTWPSDTVVHRSIGSYEAHVQGLKGGQTWIAGTDIHVIYDDEAKVYRRDPSYEYLPNAEHVYAWSRT